MGSQYHCGEIRNTKGKDRTMRRLDRLQHEATISVQFRGHRLGHWRYWVTGAGEKVEARATCLDCGAGVEVLKYPQANETEIAGPAVALTCRN